MRSGVRCPDCFPFFLSWCTVFFSISFVGYRVCFHSRVPGPDILLRITILYADVRRTKFICRCSHLPVFLLLLCVLLYCCCCSCCCSSSCAGWQELLLWFIASNPRVFFLSIQTRLIFNVRTPWQYCRICSLDLPIIRIIHPR